ncbi:HAUS augmin-like complex subunit 6 isoform X1 [Hippocampus comes]|uniref:HAUS augmin-like complex subunit 6 n=1 Tax=Hippocampus comes TaxID=109280 RepID=A0A3Q2YH02_HIPCM|nr:PREDICTED: HAUS augmin-like complex subunit 6 isoform X1 [Hippocampus comes]XP_019718816.1 PREDICTED: HAUS augmin-like complex subunit 6 isoform X1 [Hippocampus comes]
MANQTQKDDGANLWFCLLALGLQPEKRIHLLPNSSKHIKMGPNMFDKPNKDAFHIVIQFLLEKLNSTRFQQTYKFCWPPFTTKQDTEFRKATRVWLQEIMAETGYTGSKVLASLLLSPGGPKFTSLMVHLVMHVMQQEMKTFITDDSWVADAVFKPTSSRRMALKRLQVVKKRFWEQAAHQDLFLLEVQKKSQRLMDSMRDLRAESKKYDELLQQHARDSVEEDSGDKADMVRSLWATVDGMLTTTESNRKVLESVLQGDVDQHALDGSRRHLQIPRCLLQRIEQPSQQLSLGKAYEAGQLNLLWPLELMNHSLRLLKEEAHEGSPRLSLPQLRQIQQQVARQLQELKLLRLKISKEEIPKMRSAILELEGEWDRKWADKLKSKSLVSLFNDDPVLGLLTMPMPRLSFGAALDGSNASCIFSQFPAKLPEKSPECPSPAEGENESNTSTEDYKSGGCPAAEEHLHGDAAARSSGVNSSFDWLLDMSASCHRETTPKPLQATVRPTSRSQSKVTAKPILDLECDNLADQFADAVTTTSPSTGRLASLELEGILSILHGDPFNTRKQLPRTPESLIVDVKSSWQKALEEDDDAKKCDKSVFGCRTPFREPCGGVAHRPGSSGDCASTSNHSSQQSFWGTFHATTPISLQQETLPHLLSFDSLLSLEDDTEEEVLIPCLNEDDTRSALNPGGGHRAQSCHGSSSECLLLNFDVTAASGE